jgi:hypothetical protein
MSAAFNPIGAQRVVFDSGLRPSERLLLLAIIDGWSRKYPKPYPGVTELVRKTGLARQTVLDAVDSLVVSGVMPEPGKLDENGRRRSGCRFLYDIEKAVHNLDRSNAMRSATGATENRYTDQTGSTENRSSSGEKPVYPAQESGVKKAANRCKEPPEGTTCGDASQPPSSNEQATGVAAPTPANEINMAAWDQTQELRRLERLGDQAR